MKIPVITMDGPSASGKGTLSRMTSNYLKFHYLDSGIFYRLVTYIAIENKIKIEKENILVEASKLEEIASNLNPKILLDKIIINDIDVSDKIRGKEVTNLVTYVAGIGSVRKKILEKQREMRKDPGLIADGRDMGTIVFPDAIIKFFITADEEERMKRHKERLEKLNTQNINKEEILKNIKVRDEYDRNNHGASSVRIIDDYIIIDTTGKSADESFKEIKEVLDENGLFGSF